MVRLFDLTGEKKYLDFARYIVEEGGTSIANVFELAYADKTDPYQYPITKAYELISCFEGLLEYYRATVFGSCCCSADGYRVFGHYAGDLRYRYLDEILSAAFSGIG